MIKSILKKSKDVEEESCPICFESKKNIGFTTLNPCKHKICNQCKKEYSKRRITKCPMCRREFKESKYKYKFFCDIPSVARGSLNMISIYENQSAVMGSSFGGHPFFLNNTNAFIERILDLNGYDRNSIYSPSLVSNFLGTPRNRHMSTSSSITSHRHINRRNMDILSTHDHSRHVQASERIRENLPGSDIVEIVNIETGLVGDSRVVNLSRDLNMSSLYRILYPESYSIFF
jgi:hypothetical protein